MPQLLLVLAEDWLLSVAGADGVAVAAPAPEIFNESPGKMYEFACKPFNDNNSDKVMPLLFAMPHKESPALTVYVAFEAAADVVVFADALLFVAAGAALLADVPGNCNCCPTKIMLMFDNPFAEAKAFTVVLCAVAIAYNVSPALTVTESADATTDDPVNAATVPAAANNVFLTDTFMFMIFPYQI